MKHDTGEASIDEEYRAAVNKVHEMTGSPKISSRDAENFLYFARIQQVLTAYAKAEYLTYSELYAGTFQFKNALHRMIEHRVLKLKKDFPDNAIPWSLKYSLDERIRELLP